ncbi:MAG TPA: glycosyltransferase family 4 protein [Spirochaetota bacterium]|nr:glycosyltransferase family 4 protein [Spirochaetota bacterium]HPR47778.1 glycosyltransferase family 4 protein [Spirochaetota bacterium]
MKEKVKIVYFLNSLVFGGVEKHVVDLINFIDSDSFDIYLLCPQEIVRHFKANIKKEFHVFPIKVRSIFNIKNIITLVKLLKTIDSDIVNSHLYFASRFASPIARLLGTPVVIETAHIVERWRKGYRKLFLLWDMLSLKFVDGVIAVSNAVADYYITNKKVPQSKVKVIRNWCDFERFNLENFSENEKQIKKDKMGLSAYDKIVTLVGRLEDQKGHRFLIEALPLIRKHCPEIKVLFIGEGALRDELMNIAEKNKVDDCIFFLGFIDDVREILLISDVVILPSLFEGLPLTLIEASAMAVPIVASKIDGIPDIVQHGETGLLFEPGNVDDMINKLMTILDDKDRAREMGKNGYVFVRNNFDLNSQIKQTQCYYFDCLQANNQMRLNNKRN